MPLTRFYEKMVRRVSLIRKSLDIGVSHFTYLLGYEKRQYQRIQKGHSRPMNLVEAVMMEFNLDESIMIYSHDTEFEAYINKHLNKELGIKLKKEWKP